MPGLVMPAFFGESFRRGESFKDEPLGVAADDEFGAPTVLHSSSSGDALAEPATPVDRISGVVMLAPQILLKRGPLSKRSKHMSKMWQLRHVEVEGAPTHVMCYYGKQALAAGPSGRVDRKNQPRGVLPLSDVVASVKGGLVIEVQAPLRSYEFRAASPEDAAEWVRCISAAAAGARSARAGGSMVSSREASLVDVDDLASVSDVGPLPGERERERDSARGRPDPMPTTRRVSAVSNANALGARLRGMRLGVATMGAPRGRRAQSTAGGYGSSMGAEGRAVPSSRDSLGFVDVMPEHVSPAHSAGEALDSHFMSSDL